MKYFAQRIIAYYDIGRRDISTFALRHALKMEKTLGFTGLVYQEMLFELIAEELRNSLSFANALMSVSAKDIVCSAAMGSCHVEVYFIRYTILTFLCNLILFLHVTE